MMFPHRKLCCCHSRYCYIAQYIDQRLPAPEVGDAANDIDSDEGDARRVIVNRITATTA